MPLLLRLSAMGITTMIDTIMQPQTTEIPFVAAMAKTRTDPC
jgi:hypothetical protein